MWMKDYIVCFRKVRDQNFHWDWDSYIKLCAHFRRLECFDYIRTIGLLCLQAVCFLYAHRSSFDTRSYRYGYKESTTPNNDRIAIFFQESLILDILGALVPYCSPHLHSCIKNSMLVSITKNNNCKLKFICILLIESWSMLKNVGCIKEAKSTGLHFTKKTHTKNNNKKQTKTCDLLYNFQSFFSCHF